MPKISNSCWPEMFGIYSHENLTDISALSSFEMISFAKIWACVSPEHLESDL